MGYPRHTTSVGQASPPAENASWATPTAAAATANLRNGLSLSAKNTRPASTIVSGRRKYPKDTESATPFKGAHMKSHSWTPTIPAASSPGRRRAGRRRTLKRRFRSSARAPGRNGKIAPSVARVRTTRQPKISSAPHPGNSPAIRKMTANRNEAMREVATPRPA